MEYLKRIQKGDDAARSMKELTPDLSSPADVGSIPPTRRLTEGAIWCSPVRVRFAAQKRLRHCPLRAVVAKPGSATGGSGGMESLTAAV
jgi:hypothetical protein